MLTVVKKNSEHLWNVDTIKKKSILLIVRHALCITMHLQLGFPSLLSVKQTVDRFFSRFE